MMNKSFTINESGELTMSPRRRVVKQNEFANCKDIRSVVLPHGITEIREDAFNSCYALKNISLPEGLKSIGDRAFFKCLKLEMVEIPSSVESIGEDAFGMCHALKCVRIPQGTYVSPLAFRESPDEVLGTLLMRN